MIFSVCGVIANLMITPMIIKKGIDTMLLENMKKMISELSVEELETIVRLANQEKTGREEKKEAKYMAAIIAAIQHYLDNVGDLTFHVEYEDEDGCDAETEISIDSSNPPACGHGIIYI
jgi:hypothetical protein